MPKAPELWTCRLGTIAWADALVIQGQLREARQLGQLPDMLLLLEHPPTVTLGRRAEASEMPAGQQWLEANGIAVHKTDRGGRITCHEPGQLVGYPIMQTTDVVDFVRKMERSMITALAQSGVSAEVREGLTGVWCGERKIGSIGIHVQRGVTTHGFSINCCNDLSTFQQVVPCGLPGVEMTSVALEGGEPGTACMRQRVGHAFATEHGLRQRLVSPERLSISAPVAPAVACGPKVAV